MIAGLRTFLEEHRDRAVGGLMLLGGDETFWIAADVLTTPGWQVLDRPSHVNQCEAWIINM